jgi:hypothetical protein
MRQAKACLLSPREVTNRSISWSASVLGGLFSRRTRIFFPPFLEQ